MSSGEQLSIFRAVHQVYGASGGRAVTNDELYDRVSDAVGCDHAAFRARTPIGRAGAKHSQKTRTARWVQMTMRDRGWLERVPGERGVWRLTDAGKHKLHCAPQGKVLIGVSTKLGVALVGDCRDAFATFGAPIHLTLCSPPYALQRPRPYGNPPAEQYVEFLLRCLEPVVKWMAPGGSLCLVVGPDTFEPGSPARTLLIERLTIALHDQLGLRLMDRIVWHNPTRPPSPVQWASIRRTQLNAGYEFCLWFCNDPQRCFADNRRVLRPHTPRQAALIARGGEVRARSFADGRHNLRVGSFGTPTAGSIPRNVLTWNNCGSLRRYKRRAREQGLPVHGATFPLALARFFVEYLTEPGMTVVDPMAGSLTVGEACEALDRSWVCNDLHAEYVLGGAGRFDGDVWINPLLQGLVNNGVGQLRCIG